MIAEQAKAKKVLHIIKNEKVTKNTFNIFNKVTPGAKFLIFANDKYEGGDYLNHPDVTHIEFRYDLLQQFFEVQQIDRVILHSLDAQKSNVVLKFLSAQVEVIWMIWGADLYNYPSIVQNVHDPETNKILYKLDPIRQLTKMIARPFRTMITERYRNQKKVVKRLSGIASTPKGDYDMACKVFGVKPKWYEFFYYPIEVILPPVLLNKKIERQGDILLGNSGDPSNNHVSVLQKLSKLNLKQRKLVVPLSYGDKAYIKEICKIGNELFEDQFVPILDFMPIDKYYELLSNCDVVLMNHTRQQGIGNLVPSIYFGAKVFLNKSNSMYDFFLNNDINVFEIENIKNLEKAIANDLDLEVELNRKQIFEIFSTCQLELLASEITLS